MVGSQAFNTASAFKANIGAWNTAAVANMINVCAISDAHSMRHRRVYMYVYMHTCVRTCHMYPQ